MDSSLHTGNVEISSYIDLSTWIILNEEPQPCFWYTTRPSFLIIKSEKIRCTFVSSSILAPNILLSGTRHHTRIVSYSNHFPRKSSGNLILSSGFTIIYSNWILTYHCKNEIRDPLDCTTICTLLLVYSIWCLKTRNSWVSLCSFYLLLLQYLLRRDR